MTSEEPAACCACSRPLVSKYGEVLDPQTREHFVIAACPDCGLGHTRPQPSDLSRYYGAAYYGGRHGFTAHHCARRRQHFLEQVTEGQTGRLLDVGCGDGTFLLVARKRGWAVCGTELRPELARRNGLEVEESLEVVRGRAPFDAITLWHSLEHMRDPRATLEQAAGMLAPGGALILAVPDAEGMQARLFGPRWFHLDVPRHLFHFTERALRRLLSSVGLRQERTWHQEFELDLFGWVQSTLNTLLPDPNVFFYALTGRPVPPRAGEKLLSFVLGTGLSALSTPLVPIGTALRSGGTLVMSARKPNS